MLAQEIEIAEWKQEIEIAWLNYDLHQYKFFLLFHIMKKKVNYFVDEVQKNIDGYPSMWE